MTFFDGFESAMILHIRLNKKKIWVGQNQSRCCVYILVINKKKLFFSLLRVIFFTLFLCFAKIDIEMQFCGKKKSERESINVEVFGAQKEQQEKIH